jgi:hypothetical protein
MWIMLLWSTDESDPAWDRSGRQSLLIGCPAQVLPPEFDYWRFLSTVLNHNTHVRKVYQCPCQQGGSYINRRSVVSS